MPKQPYDAPDIEKILEFLEDRSLTTYASRCQNYQTLTVALEKNLVLNQALKRFLSVCVPDLKEVKLAATILAAIRALLKNLKPRSCQPLLLVPTAISILDIIKTIALSNKVQSLQTLCYEVLDLYPDDVYCELANGHLPELIDVFNLCFHYGNPSNVTVLPFNILHKLLSVVQLDKRKEFVKLGIPVWFSKMIPAVMNIVVRSNGGTPKILDTLELLTRELETIDYSDNQQWLTVIKSLCVPQKYAAVMKSLLEKGDSNWPRLWIVFVKLLKKDITGTKNHGSPINAMLSIVETAFKMDVTNRCRAFQCWNVLIENFTLETNKAILSKRIKLLLIPLKSNNAKVEETAAAKFESWWFLIRKFRNTDQFYEMLIEPFLHFCYGNPKSSPSKNLLVPGQTFASVTQKCTLAFVELVGHNDCAGCVNEISTLNTPVLNTKLIECSDWSHSLKLFVSYVGSDECLNANKKQHLKCVWNSFLDVVGSMADTKKMGNEILSMLMELVEDSECDVIETIVNDLLVYLVRSKYFNKIFHINSAQEENNHIKELLTLILHPALQRYCFSSEPKVLTKLKPITDCLIANKLEKSIQWFLDELTATDSMLALWTVLMESIESNNTIGDDLLKKLLLWPLKNMDSFNDASYAAIVWNRVAEKYQKNLSKTSIVNETIPIIQQSSKSNTCNILAFYTLLRTIWIVIQTKNNSKCTKESDLLVVLLSKVKSYEEILPLMPFITDCLHIMLVKVADENHTTFTNNTLLSCKFVLKFLCEAGSSGLVKHKSSCLRLFELMAKVLEKTDLSVTMRDDVKTNLISCLKTFLKHSKETDQCYSDITATLNKLEKCTESTDNNNSFTKPKAANKNTRKKEANIVKTVVENGEEFVVVKSNWKFNPKKLTDKQKERLQRKREDIPALYQDLSQSQDEYKIAAWKTDSQDTSISNSKSNSVSAIKIDSNSSNILKNMPSTDVIPNIIENIFSDVDRPNQNDQKTIPKRDSSPKVTTPKTKSKKGSLKDRVFLNAKNLKSSSNKDIINEVNLNTSAVEKSTVTPKSKKIQVDATYSAPSKINVDRPARAKRKPKKYEFEFAETTPKKRQNLNIRDNSNPVSTPKMVEDINENIPVSNEKENIDGNKDMVNANNNDGNKDMVNGKNNDGNKDMVNAKNIDVNSENVKICTAVTMTVESSRISTTDEIKEVDISSSVATCTDVSPTKLDNTVEKIDVILDEPVELEKNEDENVNKTRGSDPDKSAKKQKVKKSRIEKELAIDMVEGHPFLVKEVERVTRKSNSSPINSRRNFLVKMAKSGSKLGPKTKKKTNIGLNDSESDVSDLSITTKQIIDQSSTDLNDDMPLSEDFIESSQDSTMTTISVRSATKIKVPKVVLQRDLNLVSNNSVIDLDANLHDTKEDLEFSRNKSIVDNNDLSNLTPDLDTQPMSENFVPSDDVVIINNQPEIIEVNTKDTHSDTIEIAEADTQLVDNDNFCIHELETQTFDLDCDKPARVQEQSVNDSHAGLSSPFNDDDERNKDFLNNTFEISPIKSMSPDATEQKTPDKSNDYVVIQLSCPVNNDGEPLEKSASPEMFTDDKVSPDKREVSPPRQEPVVNSGSPSTSLSLKKRQPVRSGGRGAQMLGLCVPQRNSITNETCEDEPRKASITPVRRNLKMIYNCPDNGESTSDENDEENFLKFKKILPSFDSSPSGPILKRKFIDLADDSPVSPASKRKRVSFHDPPVSTTVSVAKYIEPLGIRSPQSVNRKITRQSGMKSPKKLDNLFKLETVLTNTVESLSDITMAGFNDTEVSTMDETLSVEVIRNEELNNVDPICPELIDCTDPISKIATELSSPAMKSLFLKEIENIILTIGDLAKMTELEINRLCIKAPKVKIAKQVLTEYALKEDSEDPGPEKGFTEADIHNCVVYQNAEVQTCHIDVYNKAVQTSKTSVSSVECQAKPSVTSMVVQTDESGAKSTRDIVRDLIKKSDFLEELNCQLDMKSKKIIAKTLDLKQIASIVNKKVGTSSEKKVILDAVLNKTDSPTLKDYLSNNLSTKELMSFCIELLQKANERTE